MQIIDLENFTWDRAEDGSIRGTTFVTDIGLEEEQFTLRYAEGALIPFKLLSEKRDAEGDLQVWIFGTDLQNPRLPDLARMRIHVLND